MSRFFDCASISSPILDDGFLIAKSGKLKVEILNEKPSVITVTIITFCEVTRRETQSTHIVSYYQS